LRNRRQAASIGWRYIASSLSQREGNSSIRYGNASLARRIYKGRRASAPDDIEPHHRRVVTKITPPRVAPFSRWQKGARPAQGRPASLRPDCPNGLQMRALPSHPISFNPIGAHFDWTFRRPYLVVSLPQPAAPKDLVCKARQPRLLRARRR
jgi:hypothetical protein